MAGKATATAQLAAGAATARANRAAAAATARAQPAAAAGATRVNPGIAAATARAKPVAAASTARAKPLAAAAATTIRSVPARRRAPGRPSGDGPDVRARLLDAAIACFARLGIAATSLRAIAAEAGVTPAMLHYYFGDKPQLQQAVIAERLLPATAFLRETLEGAGDDVATLVAAFVRGIGEVVARHPWLPSLWVREVLCEGGALREFLLQRVAPAIPQLMASRFAAAQRKGGLNPDLDPRLLMVSLVGLTMFPAASAPIWRRFFQADAASALGPAVDAEAMRRHTLALLDRGIGVG